MNRARRSAALATTGAIALLVQAHVSLGAKPTEMNDVCKSVTPPAEARPAGAPAYPVYLMRARNGTYSTFEAQPDTRRGSTRAAVHRHVSIEDATLLCSRGINVKWLDDAVDTTNAEGAKNALSGVGTIPSNFSIVSVNGVVTGSLYLRTFKVGWAGTTQWTTFNFQSSGFVGTLQHAFVILFFDESGHGNQEEYSDQVKLNGNGITIGDIHLRTGSTGDNGGCGSTNWPDSAIYNSQVEAFWSGSNYIYGQTCLTSSMEDGPTYYFDVHADSNNNVAYSRAGESASTINVSKERQAVSQPLDTGNWSLAFGATSGPGVNFSLNFSSVGRGFFYPAASD